MVRSAYMHPMRLYVIVTTAVYKLYSLSSNVTTATVELGPAPALVVE